MITGYPSLKTASEAVRLGAFDYIVKPVEKNTLLHLAKKALDHKALVDEKERYRINLEAIFESVNEGIISVDRDLKIISLNEGAKKICGYSDKFIGKTFTSIICGSDERECIKAVKQTINEKKSIELYRMECSNKHNPSMVITVNITPLIIQKKFRGAIMVVRDETNLIEMEESFLERKNFHNIMGKSVGMQKIYSLLEKLAEVPTTVLITGESGTGKELIAEALHYKSPRKNNHLVKVNCSALPENLLESELFGHIKGSFTGAVRDKTGKFQKAHKGTIFLDEIGDISPALQLRLLRVLQQKEFEPVGGTKPVKVDVRVLAATNKDLLKAIEEGVFRKDLYYRLNVIEIKVPPLRERREDIPLLTDYFVKKLNKNLNRNIKGVSKNVLNLFMEYPWPGNIRELEHSIEHGVVLCEQHIITFDNLPSNLKDFSPKKTSKISKKENEAEVIKELLEKTGWNKTETARIMGVNRLTIYRKIKKYNISKK